MPRLDLTTGLKQCSKCKEKKTPDSFCHCRTNADRLASWCRECQASYVKTTYVNERQAIGEKTCTKCKRLLSFEDFPSNKRRKDGLDGWCKDCATTHSKKYYTERSVENPQSIMIMSCRRRAKLKSLPCTIIDQDIPLPEECPICLRTLERGYGVGGKRPSSPSLDMYNPNLGYILGNVWVICDACNRRKQDMSGEDHVAFGMKLIETFKEYCDRLA